jgi:hypothetical protein
MNNNTIVTIKPFTGKIFNPDTHLEENTINDITGFYTEFQTIEEYFSTKNIQYLYGVDAMMELYRCAFQQFIGENPMNIEEGIAWRNINSYPFINWEQLKSVLYANYERAIVDTNNKLSDNQSDYIGALNSLELIGINAQTRLLSVALTIGFYNIPEIRKSELNVLIGQVKNGK